MAAMSSRTYFDTFDMLEQLSLLFPYAWSHLDSPRASGLTWSSVRAVLPVLPMEDS